MYHCFQSETFLHAGIQPPHVTDALSDVLYF